MFEKYCETDFKSKIKLMGGRIEAWLEKYMCDKARYMW